MKKRVFLKKLRKKLSRLPRREINERISFYSEMIDDRVEEGLSEEDAIAEIGAVDEIAKVVLADTKAEKREERTPINVSKTVLLICGFPVWFPLLISVYSVILALFVSCCAILISLWAVSASCGISSFAAVLGGVFFCFSDNPPFGFAVIGCGLICAGFAVVFFYASIYATKGIGYVAKWLSKAMVLPFMKRRKI